MESLKTFEILSFEHLIIGAFMKEDGNGNDIQEQNDESMNMNSTRKMHPEAMELINQVSELASSSKYKRITLGKQAEKECDGVISPGSSKSSSGSRRNGVGDSDEEDNGGFIIQQRKHLRDDVNFLELKKQQDQVASIEEKINLTQEGLQRLLLEMPMIEDIIQQGNSEILPSDNVQANAMADRMHRAYKIHAENVTKANLLLRIISSSKEKEKYDLRSKTCKKLRGVIDGILDGTYDTSPDKYDL